MFHISQVTQVNIFCLCQGIHTKDGVTTTTKNGITIVETEGFDEVVTVYSPAAKIEKFGDIEKTRKPGFFYEYGEGTGYNIPLITPKPSSTNHKILNFQTKFKERKYALFIKGMGNSYQYRSPDLVNDYYYTVEGMNPNITYQAYPLNRHTGYSKVGIRWNP